MDVLDFLTELNIRLGDTSNFALTSDEKTSAIERAYADPYSVTEAFDGTLTFDNTTSSYTRPSTVDIIHEILLDDGNGFYAPIAKSLYTIVGDQIRFYPQARDSITQGSTIYIKGIKGLSTASPVDVTSANGRMLEQYILNLAELSCINILINKKALSFLKNDTSIGELVTIRRERERDIVQYRSNFRRIFESV